MWKLSNPGLHSEGPRNSRFYHLCLGAPVFAWLQAGDEVVTSLHGARGGGGWGAQQHLRFIWLRQQIRVAERAAQAEPCPEPQRQPGSPPAPPPSTDPAAAPAPPCRERTQPQPEPQHQPEPEPQPTPQPQPQPASNSAQAALQGLRAQLALCEHSHAEHLGHAHGQLALAATVRDQAAQLRAKLPPAARQQPQPWASLDSALFVHLDKKSAETYPRVASSGMQLRRFEADMWGAANILTGDTMHYLLPKGFTAGANATINMMALVATTLLNGERMLVFVCDNAADMHCRDTALALQVLVDAGLADRVVLLYLAAYHGKYDADRAFGRVVTALREHDVLTLDHLGTWVEKVPKMRASVVNPGSFADFSRFIREHFTGELPPTGEFSIILADKSLDGCLMFKRTAGEKWHSFAVRTAPAEPAQLRDLTRLAACEPKQAAADAVKDLGPDCCLLRRVPGYGGTWAGHDMPCYNPDSGVYLAGGYLMRAVDKKGPPEQWQWERFYAGLRREPPQRKPMQLPFIPPLDTPSSLQLLLQGSGSNAEDLGQLLYAIACSRSDQGGAQAVHGAPMRACPPHTPQRTELWRFVHGELLTASPSRLKALADAAADVPAKLSPQSGGMPRLTPAQRQEADAVIRHARSPFLVPEQGLALQHAPALVIPVLAALTLKTFTTLKP